LNWDVESVLDGDATECSGFVISFLDLEVGVEVV
jgi:hypothetical protein